MEGVSAAAQLLRFRKLLLKHSNNNTGAMHVFGHSGIDRFAYKI
jgi:hypothetical protein